MKLKALAFTLALCFAGAAVSLAQSAHMGTWKLDEAKSKIATGANRYTSLVYEAQGEEIKVTGDGTSGDGKPIHTEWTGKFDGKGYPLSGDPTGDLRSYKTVDDHTLTLETRKDGKVTTTARVVISADGKTRTTTVQMTDASGKQHTGSMVYNRQ